MIMFTRRVVTLALASAPLWPACAGAQSSLPKMVVSKDPACGCCGTWIEYLRKDGFAVDVIETRAMNRVKARLGVPADLHSCHTAEIGGYVIEGHVPASAIKRLLSERPRARGLAVAGMPVGSPGMEVAGMAPDTYDVVLFGASGQRRYARFRGHDEMPPG